MLVLMRKTELTDEQWQHLRPLLPLPRKGRDARGPMTARRSTAFSTCCARDVAGKMYPESTAPQLPAGGG
jgi:transposase